MEKIVIWWMLFISLCYAEIQASGTIICGIGPAQTDLQCRCVMLLTALRVNAAPDTIDYDYLSGTVEYTYGTMTGILIFVINHVSQKLIWNQRSTLRLTLLLLDQQMMMTMASVTFTVPQGTVIGPLL